MDDSLQKTFLGIMAISLAIIATKLDPISRQARSWNECLDTTASFLSEVHNLQGKGHIGREAIAVNICNGAVHYKKINNNP